MTPEPPSTVTVGLVQTSHQGTKEANLDHHIDLVHQAADQGAQVVCLQELFNTSYFPQHEDPDNFDLAEPIPGPTTERMAEVAAEREVVLLVPLFERRAPGLYHNSCAVIDADGSLLGTYRKMHIPHDPNFFEKYYFTPGEEGFRVFDTRYGRLGVLICWDQWYPEAARITALKGAQLLFYPTCIGHSEADADVADEQREAWQLAQRAHALANGVPVCVANRVGSEGGLDFWGASFVADPFGRMVAQAPVGKEDVLVHEVDLGESERVRRAWPFLRDRRIDAYEGLGARYLA